MFRSMSSTWGVFSGFPLAILQWGSLQPWCTICWAKLRVRKGSAKARAQMPRGIPVATVAIQNATNAGLTAVRMLGVESMGAKKLADRGRVGSMRSEKPSASADGHNLDSVDENLKRLWPISGCCGARSWTRVLDQDRKLPGQELPACQF